MIVEFIGCAGAGKTTLCQLLRETTIGGRPVTLMPDLVRDRPLLRRISHQTAVNVLQEIGSLPCLPRVWREDRQFVAFARGLLFEHAGAFDRLNGMRGIMRKVGMYELARARARDRIVLSDEGTLLSSYNLFVLTGLELQGADVERFMRLVPLPDRVVYVRAPAAALVSRATSRPTPRRQHRGRAGAVIERDIRRTIELFELVSGSALLDGRLLVVENGDADQAARRQLATDIGGWLEAVESRGRPAAHAVAALGVEPGG